ncbi:MAG: ABC transporter substrate-binding protein [Clostridia bacterium]|nr:sugar ABC transporter substrate-binding protein [Bacillota bacterium]MBO2521775.1 sugar ABC transporter substrate-binding protein [Bacillota bacterium]
MVRVFRRTLGWAAALVLLAFSLSAQAAPLRVGITQIVEHPSLDQARQGFIDRLGELGYVEGVDIVYDIQSAQGDLATAQTIARKFQADGVDLILAIATPTAQAAAHIVKDIPILITAVTDPVAADLVQSIERPGTNVTGTSDLTPVREQLELLKEIVPQARRVGVVYNAGEVNSVVQVELARQAAASLGFTLVEATAANSSEVLQAAQSLQGRVDAIYVPTDNTVVSALESVILVAERARLPLIAGEADSVAKGALATLGIDYYKLGRQTADIAYRVLQGEDPAGIPIEYLNDLDLVVNVAAAKRMGVTIPDSVLARADQVIEE